MYLVDQVHAALRAPRARNAEVTSGSKPRLPREGAGEDGITAQALMQVVKTVKVNPLMDESRRRSLGGDCDELLRTLFHEAQAAAGAGKSERHRPQKFTLSGPVDGGESANGGGNGGPAGASARFVLTLSGRGRQTRKLFLQSPGVPAPLLAFR